MFATIGPDDCGLREELRSRRGDVLRRGVFLDRDDTLCWCTGVAPGNDLGDPSLVRLLPGAAEACGLLAGAGFVLVVVTNQGGVARGRYGVDGVRVTCERVNEALGGVLSAAYFCPYHPEGTVERWAREHAWRKPGAGMLLAAAEDLGIDLGRSWTIGDKVRDCSAGLSAGTRAILLTDTIPGRAGGEGECDGSLGDGSVWRCRDVVEAARRVLGAV